jgi:hypothetical protein
MGRAQEGARQVFGESHRRMKWERPDYLRLSRRDIASGRVILPNLRLESFRLPLWKGNMTAPGSALIQSDIL